MSSLIKLVNRLLVQPCMVEDESYAIRSRKLCAIALCVMTFNGVVLGVPYAILQSQDDAYIGSSIVSAMFCLITITSSIVPYGYLRYTKTLPDWLVEL